jgi:hypothetical protein
MEEFTKNVDVNQEGVRFMTNEVDFNALKKGSKVLYDSFENLESPLKEPNSGSATSTFSDDFGEEELYFSNRSSALRI